MKKRTLIISMAVILTAVFCILSSCDDSNLTSPEVTASKGIAAEEIQFITWTPEVTENLSALSKTVVFEKVFTQEGGVLTADEMLGCQLIVPANAFDDEERTIQASLLIEEDDIAGISFLPSQEFTQNVTIELPFDVINVTETSDVNEIRAFWLDEESSLWMKIEDVVIDEENNVVKTQINHFTRFGWGF